MWEKDLFESLRRSIDELPDNLAAALDRRQSGGLAEHTARSADLGTAARGAAPDLSGTVRSLESTLTNLGRLTPGLSSLGTTLKNLATNLDSLSRYQGVFHPLGGIIACGI